MSPGHLATYMRDTDQFIHKNPSMGGIRSSSIHDGVSNARSDRVVE